MPAGGDSFGGSSGMGHNGMDSGGGDNSRGGNGGEHNYNGGGDSRFSNIEGYREGYYDGVLHIGIKHEFIPVSDSGGNARESGRESSTNGVSNSNGNFNNVITKNSHKVSVSINPIYYTEDFPFGSACIKIRNALDGFLNPNQKVLDSINKFNSMYRSMEIINLEGEENPQPSWSPITTKRITEFFDFWQKIIDLTPELVKNVNEQKASDAAAKILADKKAAEAKVAAESARKAEEARIAKEAADKKAAEEARKAKEAADKKAEAEAARKFELEKYAAEAIKAAKEREAREAQEAKEAAERKVTDDIKAAKAAEEAKQAREAEEKILSEPDEKLTEAEKQQHIQYAKDVCADNAEQNSMTSITDYFGDNIFVGLVGVGAVLLAQVPHTVTKSIGVTLEAAVATYEGATIGSDLSKLSKDTLKIKEEEKACLNQVNQDIKDLHTNFEVRDD